MTFKYPHLPPDHPDNQGENESGIPLRDVPPGAIVPLEKPEGMVIIHDVVRGVVEDIRGEFIVDFNVR
ncbi:hypothetical protein COU74_00635 [Candidatus Peregrinibacteria bacterium CG10_big_fil_rev_8_21_14_0_10_36_19]|nr:MAG: hypothetical protein COU74_00635 [Candidatus Peregrinibacteria bacterium CG10_big_fil_rev_8_21_14_0_10_36_19]